MNKEQKKNVQYDAYAKYILSQKEVLARILKFTIAEFQDLEGEVIMELIEGEPLVSKVSTEPGETNQTFHDKITGNNTETFDGNKTAIKEAKTLLKSQGAKYRNLSIDSSSDAGKYASDIMAFPTTILVDRNGNIVGDPMLGGIDNQDNYDTLMKQIQSVIDADSTKK